MNEIIRNILELRSFRHYLPDPINRSILEAIVEAGLYTTPHLNRQSRHLTVIRDPHKIAELSRAVKAALIRMDHPDKIYVQRDDFSLSFGAPVFVLVSGEAREPAISQVDCSLALENMFLAASSFGIGSCWVDFLDALDQDKEFQKLLSVLGIGENAKIYGAGAFGHPTGKPPIIEKRRSGSVTWL